MRTRITDGGTALLGVSGVDGVVSQAEGAKLGLVRNVAVLVNAPAADVTTLVSQVQAALGGRRARGRARPGHGLHPAAGGHGRSPTGRPTSYLELFQASAAMYCPGLSWTVLAAIGQIESADGQNMGPSTAGALGPMQFLPSTWKVWGIDGFGDTGPPDIMNPFDAVPSAARLLCADGAATGGAGPAPGDLRLQPRRLVRRRGAHPGRRVRRGVLSSPRGDAPRDPPSMGEPPHAPRREPGTAPAAPSMSPVVAVAGPLSR